MSSSGSLREREGTPGPQESADAGTDASEAQTPRHRRQQGAGANEANCFIIAIIALSMAIIVLSIMAIIARYNFINEKPNMEETFPCVKYESPADKIKPALKQILPDQTADFYRVITSNIRRLAMSDEKPSCTMIASSQGDVAVRDRVRTLAGSIECALTGQNKSEVIQGSDWQGEGQKAFLVSKLADQFYSGTKVSVIYDVDKLDLESAMMFYRFCDDNDDPQHPNTMLLLTVEYNSTDQPSDLWLVERLRQSWSDDDDVIDPILSRVAYNLVVVRRMK